MADGQHDTDECSAWREQLDVLLPENTELRRRVGELEGALEVFLDEFAEWLDPSTSYADFGGLKPRVMKLHRRLHGDDSEDPAWYRPDSTGRRTRRRASPDQRLGLDLKS